MEYILLAIFAFGSATIIPFSSEVYVAYLLTNQFSVIAVVLVASVANVLGAIVNWWLGKQLHQFKHRRWFYFSEDQIISGQKRFDRYGRWSLLLAWLPIVGDVLTLVAGFMRIKILPFCVLVGIGKTARYTFFAYVTLKAVG